MLNKQLTLDIRLRDDATFSNYVGVAAEIVMTADDWLYLWGGLGSGRTHLLQACCHQMPDSIYLCGLKKLSADVLHGLEVMSLVCIDDVGDVIGDSLWEEALFHLMNAIRDQRKRIIITGDQPASGLAVKLPDLHSRLIAAPSVKTDDLSDDQKLSVLMQKAHSRGFYLGEDVGRFILSRASRDMPRLLDLLERIELETLRQGKRVTIPFVKQSLGL